MKESNYTILLEKYLLRKTTPEEEHILVEWIRENPRLLSFMELSINNMPNEIDPSIASRNLAKIQQAIHSPAAPKREQRRLPQWLRVAAMIALPLLSGSAVYWAMSGTNETDAPIVVSVAQGQKAQLSLPDGSKVWLNAHSSISYTNEYNRKERRVTLEGEGFFEVTPDKERPFRVQADKMCVEAIGTSFVIKAYPNDERIYTVLKEGKVRVTTHTEEQMMDPNDCYEYNRRTNQYSKRTVYDAADFIGWMNDQLRFENVTFEQMIKDIGRTYGTHFEIRNTKLLQKRFTGSIPNNGVESILNIIRYSVPFEYHTENGVYIIE